MPYELHDEDIDAPWRNTHRRETGLIEHNCIHGIGHPAYASADYMDQLYDHDNGTWEVHGCDGCCFTTEWITADMREGIRIANQLLLAYALIISKGVK